MSWRPANSAMVLSKEESLEKVYFDFLSILFFQIKKYISTNRRSSHVVVQRFTKKESLFKNFKD